jgi:hypothetical protein
VKRLLKTVAALTALATPAAAADASFPKDMLGVWCHDGTKYVRGDCTRENDSWMLLSPRSIEWIESGCRASSIRKLTPNLYDVQYSDIPAAETFFRDHLRVSRPEILAATLQFLPPFRGALYDGRGAL